jgi:hypothetical protein
MQGLGSNHEGKNLFENFDVYTGMILKRNTRE